MLTSLSTALVAIILLGGPAFAQRPDWTDRPDWTQRPYFTSPSRAPDSITVTSTSGESVVSTAPVFSTPVANTSAAVYSNSTTRIRVPSGIFYTGGTTGTGSGVARPTGYWNVTHTYNHTRSSAIVPSGSTSVPIISLNTTQYISHSTSTPSSRTGASGASTLRTLTTSYSSKQPSSTASSTSGPATSATKSDAGSSSTSTADPKIPFLRGVNLGGWLVLEEWMNADLFQDTLAIDEYSFSSTSNASEALAEHWATFITQDDIASLVGTGINALRIPIGFWAYDNANTPYHQGQDAYLEKAIGWAKQYNMSVWVDCHGSPGSQNGYSSSGRAGFVNWQQGTNLNRSTSVLETIAAKYGAEEYAGVVVGIELTNEPMAGGPNDLGVTRQWTKDAYAAVKAKVANPNLQIIMHDAYAGVDSWIPTAEALIGKGPKTFAMDTHLYQLYTAADNALDQSQHINKACGWSTALSTANAVVPTYVGEWSTSTNICVNPDNSTTSGTSCTITGCQCQADSFSTWNDAMIAQVRKYVEAQLDVFEASSSGYFAWSLKGPGGWGFENGIGSGIIPKPLTDRKFAQQCTGTTRRAVRGSLGVAGDAW
ncbi:Glucan 1,3-beta-glucosidase [Lachnellula subtilissima]|uniref:glucan 1,3-beta-glucosidase n=1 Tax=Lachnellula subtilissima TaxID=602034 RepID=A0A8H8U9K9_9HELO|nr:Glucan 1,3-beta-glucosidase [Lachnellula subtilissima]